MRLTRQHWAIIAPTALFIGPLLVYLYLTPVAIFKTAVRTNNIKLANFWISLGISAESTHFGRSLLHAAAGYSDYSIVELLLQNGADPNRLSKGSTPLHQAVSSERLEIVNLLVRHGASIYSIDDQGMTPLHWSAAQNNTEITIFLIEKGTDVNARGITGATALHLAASSDQADHIEILLENGAQLNAKTNSGRTPLDVARDEGSINSTFVLKRLVEGKKI